MPKMIGMMTLGRDAELRYTQSGEPVASLSLAYKFGKADPSGKRPTTWIDASLWGKRAESLAPYLTKGGQHCFTLDELHIETFQRQGGPDGIKLAAKVLDVELGARGAEPAPAPAAAPRPAPPHRPAPTAAQRPAPAPATAGDMDDDIPF